MAWTSGPVGWETGGLVTAVMWNEALTQVAALQHAIGTDIAEAAAPPPRLVDRSLLPPQRRRAMCLSGPVPNQ